MTRFTLKKHERLKSKVLLDKLFVEGKSDFCYPLKILVAQKQLESDSDWPLLFSVSVPKKKIKSAVRRNLVKRRVREAYRLNKNDIQAKLLEFKKKQIYLMFIYIEKEPKDYAIIEKAVIKLLSKLASNI